MAREWQRRQKLIDDPTTSPAEREAHQRFQIGLARRCPDVHRRCVKCGRVLSNGDCIGARCEERLARLNS